MKQKKPTKYELIAHDAAVSSSRLNSAAIEARRDLLQFEARQLEDRAVALRGALAATAARARCVEATVAGLSATLEHRR